MDPLSIFLALLPVLAIFILLVWRRTAADIAGGIGWIVALLVAWLYFQTPLSITLKSSLTGVVASFPITIMVGTSLLQIFIMLETGAISRVVTLIKTVSPRDQVVQIMIVNVGIGTLLAAMGATPVSILPPIMLAMGYSSFIAIALPAIGYDALCTYALLGIPVVVFSSFVGKPVSEVGGIFARFMPVISTCIALGMLWIVGRWKLVWRGLIPALLSGLTAGFIAIGMNLIGLTPLTGVAAGVGVVVVMLLYLLVIRRPLRDRQVLTETFVLLSITIAIGMTVAVIRSWHILWIGIIGLLTSIFYTAGPVKFKYRAFGEFAVFMMWGPLMIEGAYAVQRQALSIKAFYISIPFGVLVALVLFANNMRDIVYDSRHNVKTVSIMLGSRKSYILFTGLIVLAYAYVLVMILTGIMSLWGLLIFLSFPKAVSLLKTFKKSIPDMADALTAQFDTVFGILLILAIFLETKFIM